MSPRLAWATLAHSKPLWTMGHQQENRYTAQYLNIGWHPQRLPAPCRTALTDWEWAPPAGRESAPNELCTRMCLLLFKPEEKAHADEGILQEGLEEGDPSFVNLDQR